MLFSLSCPVRRTFRSKALPTIIGFLFIFSSTVAEGYTNPSLAPPGSLLQSLPSLPALSQPLSTEEKTAPWGQECYIGIQFAKQGDFYRAITAFQRALILLPPKHIQRKPSIEYMILLAYYLGERFEDALDFFAHSSPAFRQEPHPHHQDVLAILYDCYLQTQNTPRARQLLHSPLLSQKEKTALVLYGHMHTSNWEGLYEIIQDAPYVQDFLCSYHASAKCENTAKWLNAFLPGAGYFYLGQIQTACIAFSINALFITATCQFFQHQQWAAGLITLSLEFGWYLGGIYGATEQASLHNAQIYENLANPLLHQERCFPLLQLQRSF